MLTPKKGKPGRGCYDHLYDPCDEAELGEDPWDDRGDPDESVKAQIRRLSHDGDEQADTMCLEVRTHFSLDKIAEFEGKRYRSDASLQWLKRFIYEMKGTRQPQNSWCEPFSPSLGRAAKSCGAFLEYYCSQFDQSAQSRYYSATRNENESICDFLIRLNGYARTAKSQYEKGGADAADHVEQFLLNCGDDEVMNLLYQLQLADIQRVEQIISKMVLGEKGKKQRDRMINSRGSETRRGDNTRRHDRRETRRDDRRVPRRDDRRSRRDEGRDRRVNAVDALVEDLYHGSDSRLSSRRGSGYESWSSEDGYSSFSYADSDESEDHVDAGAVSDQSSGRGNSAERRRGDRLARPEETGERQRPGAEMMPVTGGVTTAEIAEASLANAVAMARAQCAEATVISVPGDANSASKSMTWVVGRCSSDSRSSPSSSVPL
ncbi:hypothetical protein ON010_g16480 [Phytophthora cinnamomi]|nr:hypothetical protein ON010_g16480 [Phytophthora cinnamomi]